MLFVVVQHERHRTSCERKRRNVKLVNIYHLVGDAVLDAVCCQGFRGPASLDRITEEGILGALRERPICRGTVLVAIEFKTAIKVNTRVEPVMTVAGRVHDVKLGVAEINILKMDIDGAEALSVCASQWRSYGKRCFGGNLARGLREGLSVNSFSRYFRLPRLVARSHGGYSVHPTEREEVCGLKKA